MLWYRQTRNERKNNKINFLPAISRKNTTTFLWQHYLCEPTVPFAENRVQWFGSKRVACITWKWNAEFLGCVYLAPKKRREEENREKPKEYKGLYIANERFDFEVSSFSISCLLERRWKLWWREPEHAPEFSTNNSSWKWGGGRVKKSTCSPNQTVFCLFAEERFLFTMRSWKS